MFVMLVLHRERLFFQFDRCDFFSKKILCLFAFQNFYHARTQNIEYKIIWNEN